VYDLFVSKRSTVEFREVSGCRPDGLTGRRCVWRDVGCVYRCMTAERERELRGVMSSVVDQLRLVDERRATVERQSSELSAALDAVSSDRQQLHADRRALNDDRQSFAEQLVRINTVNKIHDRHLYIYTPLVVAY